MGFGFSTSGMRCCRKWTMTLVLVIGVTLAAGSTVYAAGGGGHDGGGEPAGWAITDTYKVINFAVLAIALFFLLRKPLAQALSSRIQGIKEQLEELEAKKKEAEAQLAAYREKFQQLESEAANIVDDYIRQGKEARERILDEARSAADKLEAQARRNIEHEYQRASARLKSEAVEAALVKAEEIIKSKISTADQERLVDEYLDKVVAQ